MELTRRSVAWLIIIIGLLFAFVVRAEYDRSEFVATVLVFIGEFAMILLWALAKEAPEDYE